MSIFFVGKEDADEDRRDSRNSDLDIKSRHYPSREITESTPYAAHLNKDSWTFLIDYGTILLLEDCATLVSLISS